MNKLERANEYIRENIGNIDKKYKAKYHITPPIGWLNDPNGFSFYKGEYHLFYQYNPYDSVWGPMHWAHIKSKDAINWEWLPVALAPENNYESGGCFSGSAIEKDGKLYLMYTGHTDTTNSAEGVRQVQCLAESTDGVIFEKYENNPIISADKLPKDATIQDFRDPKVFEKDGVYYSVIASRSLEDAGQILLYKSEDLYKWDYVGVLAKSNHKLGDMWECPDLFELGGRDILIMSPMRVETSGYDFWNINSTTYMIGKLDYKTGKYEYDYIGEIDNGLDFYAPQTMIDDKGRRILVAWMQTWGREMPSNIEKHGWAGTMTLPRVLEIIDNKLYQKPIEAIRDYRKNEVTLNNISVKDRVSLEKINGNAIELLLEVDMTNSNMFGINLLKSEEEHVSISYNKALAELTFDRGLSKNRIKGEEKIYRSYRKVGVDLIDNKLKLNIFIDVSNIEIFINDGIKVMSSSAYMKDCGRDIEFVSDGEAVLCNVTKWDITI